MEVILREHIDNLGRRGDVVKVAEGYGREDTYDDAYRYRDRFVAAEASAEASRVGLWAACG